MRDDRLIGSWAWGAGPSDKCRIGETWDGALAVWSESMDKETVFGLFHQSGEWHQALLFFDGCISGFGLRCRFQHDGQLQVVIVYPGGGSGQDLFAKRSPEPRPAPPLGMTLTPDMPVELEVTLARVAGLSVRAWHRPAGAPRAPLAVVICPGIPTSQFPSFHAGSRLITELETALAERHVPVAVFDYTGVGASSTPILGTRRDPARWKPPSVDRASRDASAVIDWAKERLSDTIVVCGFSMGSACAIGAVSKESLHAYIGISMCNAASRMTGKDSDKEKLSAAAEQHSQVACKALYICGDKDRLTPVDQVRGLVSRRSDGGAGARVEVVRSNSHDLKGLEEEVAMLCTVWTLDVQQELFGGSSGSSTASTEETVASIEETATSAGETPTSAGETTPTSADEEAAAFAKEPQVVRVTCRQLQDPRSASALGIFHTSLPVGAVVSQLRQALGPGLPESAEVLDSETLSLLQDADLVPAHVTVSAYSGQITARMRLTKAQSIEVQGKLKAAAEDPAMQARLDKLEKDTGGAEGRYRLAVAGFLMTEVLPGIAAQVGLPENHQGVSAMMGAIEANSEGDLDMLERWLEIESLFRNKAKMEEARKRIAASQTQQ